MIVIYVVASLMGASKDDGYCLQSMHEESLTEYDINCPVLH